ncbi:MAG: PAS domain S-box protein [Chloroflexi bacterium]|nr:PAS domain S-box protein [Chloroflexota bacterium]
MAGARILIVEDEGIEALDIQHRLQSLGYSAPDIVFSGEDAVKKAAETCPDLVLMDIMLNGEIDGVTAAEQIRARVDTPIIYLTAYADEDTLRRAKITEPYGYILKPFRDREVHVTIDMALYRHQMERKLKESERWFATTLRSIGDAVIATDKKGLISFMNVVAENLTGWKLQDLLNKRLTEVFNIMSGQTRKPVEDPATWVMLKGPMVGMASYQRLIARDGTEIPIDFNASPMKDDKGSVIGVILVFRDITEREKAEQELRRAYTELEERVAVRTADLAMTNNHLKQEIEQRKRVEKWLQEKRIELENAKLAKERFLSSMSQQLRTVLDATVGFSDALLALPGPLSESQETQLQSIRRNAHYLLSLNSDLLDLTRIESGTVEIRTEPVDAAGVIRDVLGTVKQVAAQKGLRFIDYVPEGQAVIRTDRRALSQILLNLANNAINLTEMGRIHVEFAQHQNSGDFVTEISVVGTGSSIREELQERLFEAFRQLDSVSLRPPEGAGLGLYVSQRLAQLIGGEISLKSAYGRRAFTLTLR